MVSKFGLVIFTYIMGTLRCVTIFPVTVSMDIESLTPLQYDRSVYACQT